MKLKSVQKQLKDMGIKFDIEESVDWGLETATIKFTVDSGETYMVHKRENINALEVYLQNEILDERLYVMDTQKRLCEWLEKNKLKFTNYKLWEEVEEKRIQERREMRKKVELVPVFSQVIGDYKVTVKENQIGNRRFVLELINEEARLNQFGNPSLYIIEDDYEIDSTEAPKVLIYKGSSDRLTIEEMNKHIEKLQELLETAELIQEFIDNY